jgi:hypothetical protein
MKTEKRQGGNEWVLAREEKREDRNDQGKAQIVPENVVELIVPVRRACGILRGKIYKDAEAIDVGNDAGTHDNGTISPDE